MRGRPPKTHRALEVSLEGSKVPACGANGWVVTKQWDNVTCYRCVQNRAVIDARNARRVKCNSALEPWFEDRITLREGDK